MQQINTVKLPAIFKKFQIKERVLRVNKGEITGESTFNKVHFQIDGKQESSKDEKFLFWVSLQTSEPCFNP